MQSNRLKSYIKSSRLPEEEAVQQYVEDLQREVLDSAREGQTFLQNTIKQNPGLALGVGLLAGIAIGWLFKR